MFTLQLPELRVQFVMLPVTELAGEALNEIAPLGVVVDPGEESTTVTVHTDNSPMFVAVHETLVDVVLRITTMLAVLLVLGEWNGSETYEPVTVALSVVDPVKLTVQLPPVRLQLVEESEPEPVLAKVMLPEGVVCEPRSVSSTWAVHVEACPIATCAMQVTVVDVDLVPIVTDVFALLAS